MKTKLIQLLGIAFLAASAITVANAVETTKKGECCCCKSETCKCDGCCDGIKECKCDGCEGKCAK